MQVFSVAAGEPQVRDGPIVTPAGALRVAVLLLVIATLGFIPFFDIGSRQAPIFVNDIAIMAALAVGAVAVTRARSLRLDAVALAGLTFAAVGAISAVAAIPRFGLTPFEVLASLAYLARWLVYFAIYLLVINCIREEDIPRIWSALEGTMLAFCAFGIVQSIFLPNFAQTVYPNARPYLDIDLQGHRLMSTILEPNIAAAMILTVLLVQVALLAGGARIAWWKPTLLFVSLILTLSRSGMLGFAIGLLVILAASGFGRRMVRFLGFMLVALLASLPWLFRFAAQYSKLGITDRSAAARLVVWGRLLVTFLQNPWIGVGFNTYGFVQEHRGQELFGSAGYSAEGGLLFVAVMTGIVGLLIYGTMLALVLRNCRAVWRDPRATPQDRGWCVGAAAATVGVCVHSVFVNSLLVPFVMEPLWLLSGIAFLLSTSVRLRYGSSSRTVASLQIVSV